MTNPFLTDAEYNALVAAVALLDAAADDRDDFGGGTSARELAALDRAWRKVQLARQEHRL